MGNHYPRKKGNKSLFASISQRSPALPIQLMNTMSFLPAVPITTLDEGVF
jgi:hypothetical protein